MLIYPDIQATPDRPTIKFNQPKDQIDLAKELPRILHTQGWGCGTLFNVMFLNHEKTKLLACGRFVVTEEIETLHTNDANPYQPMTKTVFSRSAGQIGDWWPETKHESTAMGMIDVEFVEEAQTPTSSSLETLSQTLHKPIGEVPKRRGRPPNQPKADNAV